MQTLIRISVDSKLRESIVLNDYSHALQMESINIELELFQCVAFLESTEAIEPQQQNQKRPYAAIYLC